MTHIKITKPGTLLSVLYEGDIEDDKAQAIIRICQTPRLKRVVLTTAPDKIADLARRT